MFSLALINLNKWMQYVKHIPINAGIKLLCHPDASDGADNIGGIAAVQPLIIEMITASCSVLLPENKTMLLLQATFLQCK